MNGITVTGAVMSAVLIFFLIHGYRSGFLKAVFSFFSLFLTAILTWFLYPVVAGWLLKTPLYEKIRQLITATLKNNVALNESLPEYLIKLPGFMKDSIMNSSKQAFNSLVESTSEAMSVLTVNIISVIILLVVLRLLTFLVKKYSTNINRIILIGPINKILGGLFGAVQGLFVIYIAALIISFFPTTPLYSRVAEDLEVSYVGKTVFHDDSTFFGITARYPKKLSNDINIEEQKGKEND